MRINTSGIPTHNNDGTFTRIRKPFSLGNFNDGYVDNRGRFRVWYPNHPRRYNEGYILRSIVAYELYHCVVVKPYEDIHHIDGNRLNDSRDNLTLLSHSDHSILHNIKEKVKKICEHCGKTMLFRPSRLRDKESRRGRFCSQKCYHEQERTLEHRMNISKGLKTAYKEGRRG